MNWTPLENEAQLEKIRQESETHPVLLFKHSTRCSISSAALARLERKWDQSRLGTLKPYYLDLITFRSLSGRIAGDFSVQHQSPQVLLISRGKCVYHASHFDIGFEDLQQQVSSLES
ncbi:bacillithiol system redox-active protein YtxJ [Rhabdobacter roseus]|uniref:Bacillithiol system protein YtxJ n=1 Tax=Rhabdobacter roseus TaxID=1655419 RepID=A0A840TY34_9BACT|nr:bacillithiol system redox-active protein YtxJ [Rhabdobacter roseus]MBB5285108.1 bacillithiol system protein YtxJ [Rhabdobacter roseus]